jgi:hypothetical protein
MWMSFRRLSIICSFLSIVLGSIELARSRFMNQVLFIRRMAVRKTTGFDDFLLLGAILWGKGTENEVE